MQTEFYYYKIYTLCTLRLRYLSDIRVIHSWQNLVSAVNHLLKCQRSNEGPDFGFVYLCFLRMECEWELDLNFERSRYGTGRALLSLVNHGSHCHRLVCLLYISLHNIYI